MAIFASIITWAITTGISYAISYYTRAPKAGINRELPTDLPSIPTIQVEPIPVLFGTAEISPLVSWYGNYYYDENDGHYGGNIFLILCMGDITGDDDALLGIRVGNKKTSLRKITNFGGIGGVAIVDPDTGVMDVNEQADPVTHLEVLRITGQENILGYMGTSNLYSGKAAQTAPESFIGGGLANFDDCPAFRNVCSISFSGVLSLLSPVLPSFNCRMRRIPEIIGFGGGYADGHQKIVSNSGQAGQLDANPAEVIYEILTNELWGAGMPTSKIDTASFQAVAEVLFDEGFGISFLWGREDTFEEIIGEILRTIDGILFSDPGNDGLLTLSLARDDFNPATIPHYDETEIIEVTEFTRKAWDNSINEVKIRFNHRQDNGAIAKNIAEAQDLAGFQVLGGFNTVTVDYPMIVSPELAAKIATRELRGISMPLVILKMKINREAYDLLPGDTFRFTWAEFNVDEIIMRVVSNDYGNLESGFITIEAIQDIFSLKDAIFNVIPDSDFEQIEEMAIPGWDDVWEFIWNGGEV